MDVLNLLASILCVRSYRRSRRRALQEWHALREQKESGGSRRVLAGNPLAEIKR